MAYTISDYLVASGASASARGTYQRQMKQLEGWLGKRLGDATVHDIERLKSKLRDMTSGPQYARLARMFYKSADREDLRKLLVMKQRMKRLKPSDILSPKEVHAMIDNCGGSRDRALIACLWDTGVRIHELLAVNLGDIREQDSPANGGRKLFVIWFGKAKVAGEEHEGYVIGSAPALESWLKAHPDKRANAALFPSWSGGRLTEAGALRIVQRAAKRAGIEKRVYNHLFRHSRATNLLASGMSESQVRALLGWKAGSPMLGRYSHLMNKDVYRGLLKSMGLVAEKEDMEQLSLEPDTLRSIVPMIAPPGARSDAPVSQAELEELLSDPKVARVVQILQELKVSKS